MTDDQKERGNEKDDWLDMIPEERDTFDRHLKSPVDELPQTLDVIGEVEGPVFEVGPVCVGSPSAKGEKDQREAENRSLSGRCREPVLRGHCSCITPGGVGIQVYQAGDVR